MMEMEDNQEIAQFELTFAWDNPRGTSLLMPDISEN